jgi:hypothetical protein
MSTIKCTTIKNLSGVEVYTCKAWVNFNGTGTVAIRASGNVSSITDNGTGDYTVNFTSAMPDANYSVSGGATGDPAVQLASPTIRALSGPANAPTLMTTSAVRLAPTTVDVNVMCVSIFR